MHDVIIVGAGHNSLVAGIFLARAGMKVTIYEHAATPGGAVATEEVTLPGFRHDLFSAGHVRFAGSPAYAALGPELEARGLKYLVQEPSFGTLLDARRGAGISSNLDETLAQFGRHSPADARAWAAQYALFRRAIPFLGRLFSMPQPSYATARTLWQAWRTLGRREFMEIGESFFATAHEWSARHFESEALRALFVPWPCHGDMAPDDAGGALPCLLAGGLGQTRGQLVPEGGSGRLAEALAKLYTDLGGELHCAQPVTRILRRNGRAQGVEVDGRDIEARRAVIASTHPGLTARLLGDVTGPAALPAIGTMVIHLALEGPIAWHAGEHYQRAGYLHLNADTDTLRLAYANALSGRMPEAPLVVWGQPSAVDATRAPAGRHTAWLMVRAMPMRGIDWDAQKEATANRVIAGLERYGPIRQRVLARTVCSPLDLIRRNPSLGGVVPRPLHASLVRSLPPRLRYTTPTRGLYQIGAGTFPGPGLSGTSGMLLAQRLLR